MGADTTVYVIIAHRNPDQPSRGCVTVVETDGLDLSDAEERVLQHMPDVLVLYSDYDYPDNLELSRFITLR